ncbi:hypothetical protein D0809_01040 [Flavobacterium circumlabens]|uniref:Uncharacterized protein n=1 Tax=Flavobacterium circumlabens TaxID=2133765 RepID=A0A4Y7UGN3_9FLAO|nr:hypothetical protein [Flavobacterium circumlabens]TCN60461.1 hypothetical protein EV142_10127 [Flavobacterium circumlabens]TEB45623.1 hypothetical protein D0809_01040 [Flavobacterium circumlabens]
MIKKIVLMSLVLSQLAISCSSDDSNDEITPETEQTLAEQIANIVKQPYSKLTPTEQKTKLEVEANEMLVQLDKSKTSGAIEAIQNLGRLFSLKHIDLFDGKTDNGVEEVLNISGVYGIYTWNNAQKNWTKTASTTELKFVFPAKESQTANNAVLSSKSTSSDIKFKNIDTYSQWVYNPETGQGSYTESINDWFFLPTSVDAVLTIDGTQSATLASTAKYSTVNKSPEEFTYKVTLNDGYTWEMSGKKGTETTAKAAFTFNGKNLIEFNSGSTAQIDALIDNDEIAAYKGKANGLIKIMDNFIIVTEMDLATAAADDIALAKSVTYPVHPDYEKANSDFKAYYTAINTYNQKYAAGTAANFNKNMKLILVSKKDGTKIADIVQHEEKGHAYNFNLPVWNAEYEYWQSGQGESFTQQYYDEISYLKFNDNTEVAMSVYFSSGFENLETKFEDFAKSFKK